ncbi:MAG TPA: benenodin family lasso peptide [Asticcacaulis sp.]|nr:benenodin family lasso peptide [Asticcacaulis sp.]
MTKTEHQDEKTIDLGAASVETKGESKFPQPDAGQIQYRDLVGLSAD